jgi:transposase-like protein
MDTHKNASLTPKGREAMARSVIEGGLSKGAAARQFNTTPKTVARWVARFRAKGVAGLQDRSSRPHSSPSQATPAVCAAVEGLRRRRHTRRADRRRGRRFGGNCQPHPQTAGPQSPVGARAGRTGPSL